MRSLSAGVLGKIESLLLSHISIALLFLVVEGAIQLEFSENCAICSCSFGMSVEDRLTVFLCSHLGLLLNLYIFVCLVEILNIKYIKSM